ncbi:hypothetical protein C4B63_25g324 [Trypanosoma cruzi]|uniref:C2H2-type domain-containing protein n=1 Tax=Trypanosoma cruzi TaxID=5693 RepID=A0A2V2VJQ6_TRYCR|nr:hypothetical protein C4B63_25g324 [Trypanosoma cruzi]
MAAASFEFVQGSERLDWGVLVAIDLQRLMKDTNVDTLQRIVENIAFARVTRDEAAMFTPEHILHLFTLCQLVIQYLVCSQECLAKINVKLTERLQEMQHRRDSAEAEREKLHEENVILRKEVKAQRRTLLAYEYANSAGGGVGMTVLGGGQSYICPQCGDAYTKKESLQSHVRKRHAGVKNGASPQSQPQEFEKTAYEAQQLQQRQLQEKVEKLEKLLEKEKERNERIQHDSMMMLMQAAMGGAQTKTPSPSPMPPPATAAVAAAPTATQKQQTQETLERSPQFHAPPLQVLPEVSAIPVMPDIAALQRYNMTRQQEAANNALLRKVSELEALICDLKSTKKDTAEAHAAPVPEPARTTVTVTPPMEVSSRPPPPPSTQTKQKEQQQSSTLKSHNPSWLTAPGISPAGQTHTAERGEEKTAAEKAAASNVTPAAVPTAAKVSVPSSPSSSTSASTSASVKQRQASPPPASTSAVSAPVIAPPPLQQKQQQQQKTEKEDIKSTQLTPMPVPVPVPLPVLEAAPKPSGMIHTTPPYVSNSYTSLSTNAQLNTPSVTSPSLNLGSVSADKATTMTSEMLLEKYGPPGPAIVPQNLAKQSLPSPTNPVTKSAPTPSPAWLHSSTHPDDGKKEALISVANAPSSIVNAASTALGTSVSTPSMVSRSGSGNPPPLSSYPSVPVAVSVDFPRASQQQAPPPTTIGLEPRLSGPPYTPPPPAVPVGPSYSSGVVLAATGVPHAALPVVKRVKPSRSSGSSSFEGSTSSSSS